MTHTHDTHTTHNACTISVGEYTYTREASLANNPDISRVFAIANADGTWRVYDRRTGFMYAQSIDLQTLFCFFGDCRAVINCEHICTLHAHNVLAGWLAADVDDEHEKRDLRARRYAVDPLAQKAHAFARNERTVRGGRSRADVLWDWYNEFKPSFINKLNK